MKVFNQVCHHENAEAALDVMYHAPTDSVHFLRYAKEASHRGMEQAFSVGFLLLDGVVSGVLEVAKPAGTNGSELLEFLFAQSQLQSQAFEIVEMLKAAIDGFVSIDDDADEATVLDCQRLFLDGIVIRIAKSRHANPVASAANEDATMARRPSGGSAVSMGELHRAARGRGRVSPLEALLRTLYGGR